MMEVTDKADIRCAGCGKEIDGYLKKEIRCPYCGCRMFTILPKDWFGEMRKYFLEVTTLKQHRDFLDRQEDEELSEGGL